MRNHKALRSVPAVRATGDLGRDNTPIMVKLPQVYTLYADDTLTEAKLHEILQGGFSRIPILQRQGVDGSSQTRAGGSSPVVGILLVKNLITRDPSLATPISQLIQEERARRRRQAEQQANRARSSLATSSPHTTTYRLMHNTAAVLIEDSILRVHQDISIFGTSIRFIHSNRTSDHHSCNMLANSYTYI
eukprot:COSAG05_NODE_445_length_9773_cov_4.588071_5_plen_190_part_00